ncbi:class I SAM-dependent methyltransferase [Aeromonas caviae]|uniref:class I SAM-dependent methyltransferase n=1 Tax=Aeromonas caviae TaxID=648 RepID=UPI002B486E50|nr:class I SAM-dependent methyltransferase [Aeromonas caviae]
MSQNIYDEPGFFEGYAQLPRSLHGLAGAPEWPALHAMLPELAGKRVLDLGCGYGWFCRAARDLGAADVVGIDLSAKMLARAAELTRDETIRYRQGDLDGLALSDEPFDLIYSSLALHYLPEVAPLFAEIHRALAAAWCSRWSTPSSPARSRRAGWWMQRDAAPGPSTATRPRASGSATGWRRG